MTESTPPTPKPDHDPLRLRHVLSIVLAGAALGLGFNALQLSANPARALPWVKTERRVVTLERVSHTDPVTTADATPSAEAPSTPPPAQATPAPAAAPADSVKLKPAPASSVHAKTPAKHAAPSKATAARAIPAPAEPPAIAAVKSVPAANLPVIPDSRDPVEVGLDVAQKFHAADAALFLDARSAAEYAEGHIAGALNLPFDDVFKNPALAKAVDPKGRVIITYCSGGDCDLSKSLAFSLIDAGFRKVLVFTDGIPAWTTAGKPVHKGAQP